MASFERAASLAGALFQIALANDTANRLAIAITAIRTPAAKRTR